MADGCLQKDISFNPKITENMKFFGFETVTDGIIILHDDYGLSPRKIAPFFGVSYQTTRTWIKDIGLVRPQTMDTKLTEIIGE